MKKKSKIKIALITLIIIIILGLLCFGIWKALNYQPINPVSLDTLEANENINISYNEESKVPTLIAGDYTDFKVRNSNEAIHALEEVKDVLGIENPKEEYKESNEIEFLGNKTYRLQQYYKEIEVSGRQMVITTDQDGNIKTVSGDYEKITDLDVNPSIDKDSALNQVITKYGDNIKVNSLDLVIEFVEDVPTLCYIISAYGNFSGLDGYSYYFLIDAKTGEIVKQEEDADYAATNASGTGINGENLTFTTNKTLFNYEMYDPKRKIEIRNYTGVQDKLHIYFSEKITSKDNTWNDQVANQAMVNVSKVYDYFYNKFKIKSISGNNSKLTVVVNSTDKVNNASYIRNLGNLIIIGTGDGVNYTNFVNGLDVLGHEFMHGYTKNTDKNILSQTGFEKGEIDEAYGDVMGNIIENYYREKDEVMPVSENENLTFENDKLWIIGEDVALKNEYGLRSMANPELNGQPSKIGDNNYLTKEKESDDSKIVHNNSTVLGNAFYLMWKNGITADELAKMVLDSCNRLSRSATYVDIANMFVALTDEYCPEKREAVIEAFESIGLQRSGQETSGSKDESVLNQNIDEKYIEFIKNKEYEKDEKESFRDAKYYCILDINKDGIKELFIQDEGDFGFFSTLIYTYDKEKDEIIFIDNVYSYNQIRYDSKENAIVYSQTKPFKYAGGSGFYKLVENKLELYKTIGYNGDYEEGNDPNYMPEFFVNTNENGNIPITKEEFDKLYDDVENLEYIEISKILLNVTDRIQDVKEKGISDLINEAKKENIPEGEIKAGNYSLKYGIYRSSLQEYEMLGGIYIIKPNGKFTYRNIWKNVDGDVKNVDVSGTYTVEYRTDINEDEKGYVLILTSNQSETMGNQTWQIKNNNSFEAIQYPNMFTYVE